MIYTYSIKGTASVKCGGGFSQENVDAHINIEIRDATLALDEFISSNDQYWFSGRDKTVKPGIDSVDWVQYSEDSEGNSLTVELVNRDSEARKSL